MTTSATLLQVRPCPFEAGDGTIRLDADGHQTLIWERPLQHGIEQVWHTLTDGNEVRTWARASWDFEPRVGGAMTLILDHGAQAEDQIRDQGRVSAWQPQRLLEFTINYYNANGPDTGEHVLRFALAPDGDGCILHFSDRFAVGQRVPNSIACGWHFMLDRLEEHLVGTAADWSARDAEMERIYWRYRNAPRPDGWPA